MDKFQKELIRDRAKEEKTKIAVMIADWLTMSIKTEAKIIALNNSLPSKLYCKYPFFDDKDKKVAAYQTEYGTLQVIIDPEMKELMRVE